LGHNLKFISTVRVGPYQAVVLRNPNRGSANSARLPGWREISITTGMKHYDGVALFSGGLDSILAARLIMEQGLSIQCLHFISPFFGKPGRVKHWEQIYGLEIKTVDVSDDYAALLSRGPAYGYGSVLNPCVDCKILMMHKARERMEALGAKFIVSGEVLGQRPMSQRRDTLNVIRRDGDVKDVLLRPLCAQYLEATAAEDSGLVDRSKLLGISGRGRKDQLALAERMGIKEIPTPAGGCMLGENENARRYWPVLEHLGEPTADDFRLANRGRQLWHGNLWLSIGRDQADNEAFQSLIRPEDTLFKVVGFPGPLALGRNLETDGWTPDQIRQAASLVASYSPKACQAFAEGSPIIVRLSQHGQTRAICVEPERSGYFAEPTWPEVHAKLQALRKRSAQ
jgi:hypothetical protein